MVEKETIKQAAYATAFVASMIGIGYVFSPNYYHRELKDNYVYCDDLLEKASGDDAVTHFVHDKVSVMEGLHSGKTCREIIEEYQRKEP